MSHPAQWLLIACLPLVVGMVWSQEALSSAAADDAISPAEHSQSATSAALADLQAPGGSAIGRAVLTQKSDGVQIKMDVAALPPGEHTIHIHSSAWCPGSGAAGAGDRPSFAASPLSNPNSLPTLVVGSDGTGSYRAITPAVTTRLGDPSSLFTESGSSLVVHRQLTESEIPLACGTIIVP